MDFYKSLNYSFGNEDWNVENQALKVAPGDSVLCVTASGDRPLHLLLTPCKKVLAIDLNHSQTALLYLKMATFSQFDYEKSLAFLGCTDTSHRLTLYQELKKALPAEAAFYWDNNKSIIKKGVIYQGRTEKLCLLVARILRSFRKGKNNFLFSFTDINEQKQFVETHWDTPLFRKLFGLGINPKIFKLLSNDPGITAFTEYTKNPGIYFYEKMLSYLKNHLARKSVLLQLLFLGYVRPEAYLPYLTFTGFYHIRSRLSLIETKTCNIVEFLSKTNAPTFNCFSMSDIASYMPQLAFEQLLRGIKKSAHPKARFCLRELISKRFIPAEFADSFQRIPALEQYLEKEESNFVYRFMVGTINI